jgi:glycosyltransferase involved in cell wall biosynthesis
MAKNKLRLLFLTYQGGLAGSTNSIVYLASGLADLGHEVFVGCREDMLIWQLLEGSKANRIAMTFNGKFDFNNWKQIRDAVKLHDIQIINAQSSYDRYTSIFAKWRYNLNVEIIHTRRQMPISNAGFIQSFIYNKGTRGIVAVSQQVKDALVKLGLKAESVKVIHNGTPKEKYNHIDDQKVASLKEQFKIEPNDFVIGCISRPKNQIQILESLKLIENPVKVIFCGIEASEEMMATIRSYAVPHQIYFVGSVEASEILNYYKIFTINILASTMEGLSQSLLEAMALGVPVVATAFAGNLDLIEHEKNGLLFQDGDIQALAKHIQNLKSDTLLRKRLIEEGQVTAFQKFSIENTIQKYEEYFLSLLAEN